MQPFKLTLAPYIVFMFLIAQVTLLVFFFLGKITFVEALIPSTIAGASIIALSAVLIVRLLDYMNQDH